MSYRQTRRVAADVRGRDIHTAGRVVGRRHVVWARGDAPDLPVDAAVTLEEAREAVGQAIRASVIADLHREHVVRGEVDGVGCIEDEAGIAAAMLPKMLTIDVDVRDLEDGFKIHIDALPGGGRGGGEMSPVP